MEDLKSFLKSKVLLHESDTLHPDVEKELQLVRREKISSPVINISSGTSSIIAGSQKTYKALLSYPGREYRLLWPRRV